MSDDKSALPRPPFQDDHGPTPEHQGENLEGVGQAARDVLDFVKEVTSSSKIIANRKNAQKSTGPRTRRGKSLSRLNAWTHGAFATVQLVPGESEIAYQELSAKLFSEAKPQTSIERMLVEQILGDLWRLRRVAQAEGAYFEQIGIAQCLRARKSVSEHAPAKNAGIARCDQSAEINSAPSTPASGCAGFSLTGSSRQSTCALSKPSANAASSSSSAPFVEGENGPEAGPGKLMLDGMVDPHQGFPYATLEYIRRSLVRGVLRKNEKLAELRRLQRLSPNTLQCVP